MYAYIENKITLKTLIFVLAKIMHMRFWRPNETSKLVLSPGRLKYVQKNAGVSCEA